MVQEIIDYTERFDADGNCASVALDFIIKHLLNKELDIKEFKKLDGIVSIINFLKKNNLSFTLNLPPISWASPITWYLYLLNPNRVFFNKAKNKNRRAVTLYHLNCNQLYSNLYENWTHFIVGYYDRSSIFKVYDPLLKIIQKEDATIDTVINQQYLDNIRTTKLVIWNDHPIL